MGDCIFYNNCKTHEDCGKFCMMEYKLGSLFRMSQLSQNQWKKQSLVLDYDGTDKDQYKRLSEVSKGIESFVESGENLYIHSTNCGNGKTAWATRLVQSYLHHIWLKSGISCRALFISVPRLLLALKDNITTKSEYVEFIKENVLNADLVVWDEVGSKSTLTPFETEHLFSFINTRIELGKSNIYTSNLSKEELHNSVGDRLYSRIVNYSEDIEFKGADKRGINV